MQRSEVSVNTERSRTCSQISERRVDAGASETRLSDVPIGCQTVFISRKAAIHSGRSAARSSSQSNFGVGDAGRAAGDPLDVLGGDQLDLGPQVRRDAPDVERVDVDVAGEDRHQLRLAARSGC